MHTAPPRHHVHRPEPRRPYLAWLLPSLLIGVYGLWLKYRLLDSPLGFSAVARLLNRPDAHALSLVERLALFQQDLALNLLALPLAVWLMLWLVRGRWRRALALVLNLGLLLAFFLGAEAVRNVGRFLTVELAADAWAWVWQHPENLVDYALASHWPPALAVLILSTVFILTTGPGGPWGQYRRRRLVLGLGMLAALGAASGFQAGLPALPQGRALLLSMAQALLAQPPGALSASIADKDLPAFFRDFSRTPTRDDGNPLFGKEKGADVLVFVLETGPRETLDLAAEAERLPGLKTLRPHAFLSSQHYTSYPYTSDALFSLLGGVYPLNRKDYLRRDSELAPLGLMAALSRKGYRTAVYSPDKDSFEADLAMYRYLGAQERYVAEGELLPDYVRATAQAEMDALPQDSTAFAKFADFTRRRFLRDRAVLERVKSDLVRDKRADKRFCAVVLPQLGHAPWLNLGKHAAIAPRGAELMARQMAWLDELVSLMAREGWLDNTLVLVTADHGIRTRAEDPAFRAGQLSAYSFNVPLLLHAPRALAGPRWLEQPSSHIDLTPTLLSLLGITEGRESEQGLPLWESALAGRTLGLFAGDYLGADGYWEGDAFTMREAFSGTAYRAQTLDFSAATPLPPEQAHAVAARLDTWYALQARWLALAKWP
ncbi:MAG: sulfatase-like hydrolase/transferase [Gammaproteobacteria bacterium]|nr:sulfatase-like hydrolase/transferase [Gammaproteobacteria bacterium]